MVLTVPRTPLPHTLWPQALAHLIVVFSQAPQHLRPSLTAPPGSWGPNSPGPKGHQSLVYTYPRGPVFLLLSWMGPEGA